MRAFFNEDNGNTFSNPGMGWVIHHAVRKDIKDPNEPDRYDNLDNVALLSQWSLLEPQEGEFYWDDLDASIEKWTKLGKKVHFRISSEPMIYNNQGEGVPKWLIKQYDIPFQKRKAYGVDLFFPDYLNPVYCEKLSAFLNALSERYARNQNIELVDLRGYGEWGEWHSGYCYNSYARRSEALRNVINIWHHAFGKSKILMLSCSYEWRADMKPQVSAPQTYEEYLYWSAFDYALRMENISFRRDGIAGAVKQWDSRLMNEYYRSGKNLPMVCEFFSNYSQALTEDGVRGYHVDDAVEEALSLHPNYMMLMWDSVRFYNERPDLIAHGLRRMGYRLLPRVVRTEERAEAGEYVTLIHEWVNCAAGRCWKKCILEIKLASTGCAEGRIQTEDSFDPSELSEGISKTWFTNLAIPKGTPAGSYDIRFGVLCPEEGTVLTLPLDSCDGDGYYTVAQINVC